MGLTKQIVYIGDFYEEAQKRRKTWGTTSLYSTGSPDIDNYLGGGFGREEGYEIVLLYGPTGIGKSTVALNMIAQAIALKTNVGLLVLEDDMPDVVTRLQAVMSPKDFTNAVSGTHVRCLPDNALTKSWNLNDLLKYIEDWFDDGIDLILLDHLQFAFENAESVKGENEYIAQRVFMQRLNQVIKQRNKTIILVSHMNKANTAKGMDRIVGSGALAQAATKVIEISKVKDMKQTIEFNMHKSRFTPTPDHGYCMRLVNGKLTKAYE